jgi:hypothetical protein
MDYHATKGDEQGTSQLLCGYVRMICSRVGLAAWLSLNFGRAQMFVFATFAGAPVLPKTLAQVVTLAVQDNIAAQIWGRSCVAQSLPDSILDVGLACTFHWHWPALFGRGWSKP